VSYINEKLKRYRELVIHQAGGDEHALRVSHGHIAMADGAVT
jgi:hypothetical protein